ncbi:MAG TPA: hypothetical protein VLA72_09345 [Anaerolineales bacterium]|nr:hypothetical protein [Anaerolineales bacterium]
MDIQIIAGSVSTVVFVVSSFLMVYKAYATSDLDSYSLGNLIFSNLGNLIHWIYISSLPFGPIWFLHAYYTLITALMLFWYFRFRYLKKNKFSPAFQELVVSQNNQVSSLIDQSQENKKYVLDFQQANLRSNSIIECLCGCIVTLWNKIKNSEKLTQNEATRFIRFSWNILGQSI